MIVYLLITSNIFMATIISGFVKNTDNFSDVITSDVSVIMDELNIINNYPNFTTLPQCQLTLHRKLCTNPAIQPHETVGWDTRICFNWKCLNTSEFVMRVENCWTGSIHNPVFLIDENGCSLEKSMIRSPRYYANLTQAYSLGWLSVRLVGSKHIRLSCSIRLCHICDKICESITPPTNCEDNENISKAATVWNDTQQISTQCYQSHNEKQIINKAAATSFSYTEIFGFVCLSFITFLIFHR